MSQSAEDDATRALAMIRLANSLGQRVPWANLLDAWPDDRTALSHAVDTLVQEGLIEATPTGLVTLGAPPRPIPPAETGATP